MKRLAAFVLLAFMNLLGTFTAEAALAEVDGSGGLDERRQETREVARRAPDAAVALASVASGEPVEAAWMVRHADGQSAVAMVRRNDHHVGLVNVTVDGRDVQWSAAVLQALQFCRESGSLKIVIDADGVAALRVRSVVESCGFQFSRSRQIDGADVLEFYTDLYWTGPRVADG